MKAGWVTGQNGRLTADGLALEYRCWGPPPQDAPTLVMLHEGLGCVALWRDVPEQLAAATGLGVLAYSRAGYGGSDPGPLPRRLDYQTHEGTSVLAEMLERLDIRQCILLGHSDGATMAAIYAGSVSDMRVRGLVLIAPHFFTEPSGQAAIVAAGRAYTQGDLRTKLARYHDDVDNAFYGWHDVWLDPGYAGWNVADVIDHWRVPVLVVQGDADPYGTLAQVDEIATRIYAPLETLILPGCGHAPHHERSDETMTAVKTFCARLMRLEQAEVALD